ncbi:hypothetical protein Bca4012_073816 [Brassica carinata]
MFGWIKCPVACKKVFRHKKTLNVGMDKTTNQLYTVKSLDIDYELPTAYKVFKQSP